MRIVFLDTYYTDFLRSCYEANLELSEESYSYQHRYLINQVFGTSDFYSRHLNAMGYEAIDVIANCVQLQTRWAQENRVSYSDLVLRLPQIFLRLPVLSSCFDVMHGLTHIFLEQVKSYRPEILYCQNLWFLTPQRLRELRPYVKLIVGQTASPLPPNSYVQAYDLILTSFPHFVPRLRALGVSAEYFQIGFDTKILDLLGEVKKDMEINFVGGVSRHHGNALPLLEYLAQNTPIEFFGYGAQKLKKNSPIRGKHNGEVWGLDMYRALARSRITFNRHINTAENYANNMRLYEATGVGTLLITDYKDNLQNLFEIGKEVVAYRNKYEAVELINYYMNNPEEASLIACAGQARTLYEHSYKSRMNELVILLDRYMKK